MSRVAATPSQVKRLNREHNIWLATVGSGGGPHLVPVWFVYVGGDLYFCTAADSVKVRNLQANRLAVLALEKADHPLVCYGQAEEASMPWDREVARAFQKKYAWDIRSDAEGSTLWRVVPTRWWGD